MNPEPDNATLRLIQADEISELICLGYSVRAASMAVGVPPSTGRRWLGIRRDLLEASFRATPVDPGDLPF